jgi:hypothetical protein
MGVGNPQTTAFGPGHRVYKLKVHNNVKEKLKEFYNLLISFLPLGTLPKTRLDTGRSGRTASYRLFTAALRPGGG